MAEFDWLSHIYKWLSVMIFSMIKFAGGPLAGTAFGLTPLETILFTIVGMMLSVVIVTYFGQWLKKIFASKMKTPKPVFTKKNRNTVRFWKKYGIWGVAALTPILFTPIGGTAIVVSFGEPAKRILVYMLIAAVFWAVVITYTFYFFGNLFSMLHH